MQKKLEIQRIAPTMNWIIKDDDPRIRLKSTPIELPLTSDNWKEIQKMVSYIDSSYDGSYEKHNIVPGVAIASNQINWQKRVIYLHFDDEYGKEKRWLLANPVIVKKSNTISYLEGGEGCLSVPENHDGVVPRQAEIMVQAYDLINNQEITIEEKGFSAIVLQHEIDHLDGILYYDHINVLDANFTKEDWKKI